MRPSNTPQENPSAASGTAYSRVGVALALAPALLFVLLYFSLAVHLRLGLGRWPQGIGETPGTVLFQCHESVLMHLRTVLALSLFALPVAFFVLLWLRLGHRLGYMAVYAGGLLIAWAAMHLAPGPFQDWFWD